MPHARPNCKRKWTDCGETRRGISGPYIYRNSRANQDRAAGRPDQVGWRQAGMVKNLPAHTPCSGCFPEPPNRSRLQRRRT